MDSFTHTFDSLLHLLILVGGLVVNGINATELWLRIQLTQFGVTPMLQTILLLGLSALLMLGSIRLFGGLIRSTMVLVIVLIAVHIIVAAFQA